VERRHLAGLGIASVSDHHLAITAHRPAQGFGALPVTLP
jgi:hypothetical protein